MAKGGYRWELNGPLPIIHDHSRAKHDVLRAYLVNYLRILAQSPRSEGVRVTLVDGFAGGGQYRSPNGEIIPGSPLILLDALAEARALVALDRAQRGFKGPYVIQARIHLVEENAQTFAFLHQLIQNLPSANDAHTSIALHHGRFEPTLPAILEDIRARQRGGRSVFVLDQYGWSQVDLRLVCSIFQRLPSAEVFLTWMIDNLINFLSEQTADQLDSALARTGLSEHLTAERLLALKATDATDHDGLTWRRAIQSLLVDDIRAGSGANYCTPFYIVPLTSRRGYWLLHLAQHLRANEEMKRIHWQHSNSLQHPGGPGLNMLSYVGSGGQLAFDHRFDESAQAATLHALHADLPKRLTELSGAIRFGDLVASTANETPAHRAQMQDAVFKLAQERQLMVHTVNGAHRRGARGVADDDVVELAKQMWLIPH